MINEWISFFKNRRVNVDKNNQRKNKTVNNAYTKQATSFVMTPTRDKIATFSRAYGTNMRSAGLIDGSSNSRTSNLDF
jgi:hypothetical protein